METIALLETLRVLLKVVVKAIVSTEDVDDDACATLVKKNFAEARKVYEDQKAAEAKKTVTPEQKKAAAERVKKIAKLRLSFLGLVEKNPTNQIAKAYTAWQAEVSASEAEKPLSEGLKEIHDSILKLVESNLLNMRPELFAEIELPEKIENRGRKAQA